MPASTVALSVSLQAVEVDRAALRPHFRKQTQQLQPFLFGTSRDFSSTRATTVFGLDPGSSAILRYFVVFSRQQRHQIRVDEQLLAAGLHLSQHADVA